MTPLSSHDQTDSMLFFEKEGEVSSAGRFIVAGHNKHCNAIAIVGNAPVTVTC